MAAETRHAGLTADERSTIRSTVLKARETIENDLYRQLERYGVYDDERVDIDALGHLDAYDKQIRSQIDAALDRELEATDDYERSVKNYVREATKTYLNRLVALKAIEVRGLVTETMIKRPEYGNRSEMHRTVDEVAGELTDQPDNGLGVAVELAFTELTDEIGVIFEESEHTAIDLDFTVREEIIEQLNAIDESVWESDEAMGWVYQYFGENEREEIDDRIDEENYKVQDTDVATKTQLFTPRYIVEWMVDNSLGRLWLEMYGSETDIDDEDNCFYLAPLEESLVDRDVKDVRDIKVLDPACGSGHMLFYAFDVLYEMYLEQGDVAEKYIPREILANNLYGIDIDPGAAQLAALALYVKAKNTEPDAEIEKINIVSADAVLVNGDKKEEVLSQTDSNLERRVLEQVWTSFEHVREWGSLVRIEEQITDIIKEEIDKFETTGQTKFTDDGLAKQSSVVSYSGEEESWEQVKERLLGRVSEFAEEALAHNDPIEDMFADEVEKSVQLLDLFINSYDVVVSNPPYLGSGKMGDTLKEFIKNNYKGSRDAYSAFIERCGEFAGKDCYTSMITLQGFMFLSSYEELRNMMVSDYDLVEYTHSTTLQIGSDETVVHVMKSKSESESAVDNTRFNRLVNSDDKIKALQAITEANRENNTNDDVYVVDQNSFNEIEETPFTYWFGENILKQFSENEKFEELVFSQSGIKTGNNRKFLRKIWEVPKEEVFERYLPVAHSGNSIDHYDETTFLMDWKNEGEYIENYGDEYGHQYFFGQKTRHYEESIGFQIHSKYFVARYIPEGHLGLNQLYLIYPDRIDEHILYVTSWLNSSLVKFLIDGFNPTVNFTQGDVFRLPYPLDVECNSEIVEYTSEIISRIDEKSQLKEKTLQFDVDKFKYQLKHDLEKFKLQFDLVDADRMVLHGLIDDLIFQEYNITETDEDRIYDELPENLSRYPHRGKEGELFISEYEYRSEVPVESLTDEESQKLGEKISEYSAKGIRNISEELGVSPYTVANLKYEHDLYTRDERRTIAGRVLSFYIGCALGNWELEGLHSKDSGIIVFDSDFDDNVMTDIRRCIELTYGDDELYERENEIEELLNTDIEDWLRNTFFRYHHCKEYRRRGQRIPIYWQLESDHGAFSCFVYYHSMDADTLPKLRGQYIDKKLDTLQNRLEAIESELDTVEGDRARELRSEKEELQAKMEDISEFRDRVDALIDEGFEPDFEAGIWENIQKVDEHDLLAVPLDKL